MYFFMAMVLAFHFMDPHVLCWQTCFVSLLSMGMPTLGMIYICLVESSCRYSLGSLISYLLPYVTSCS
jgi:hypothetical protein